MSYHLAPPGLRAHGVCCSTFLAFSCKQRCCCIRSCGICGMSAETGINLHHLPHAGHTAEACAIVSAALLAGEQPQDKLQQVLRQLEAARAAKHGQPPRTVGGHQYVPRSLPPLLIGTPATAQVTMKLTHKCLTNIKTYVRYSHRRYAVPS